MIKHLSTLPNTQNALRYMPTFTHSHTDGRGCHARCQTTHQDCSFTHILTDGRATRRSNIYNIIWGPISCTKTGGARIQTADLPISRRPALSPAPQQLFLLFFLLCKTWDHNDVLVPDLDLTLAAKQKANIFLSSPLCSFQYHWTVVSINLNWKYKLSLTKNIWLA